MPRVRILIRLHKDVKGPLSFGGRGALLLDRDGVLVEEKHYLSHPDDVVLSPGAIELLRFAHIKAIPVCVITNQSGLDRGLFDASAFEAVSDRIDELLNDAGTKIDITLACPFHPDFTGDYSSDHAHFRKPGPGMFELLSSDYKIALMRSLMVGDNVSDIAAAKAAGVPRAIHVITGHGQRFRKDALALASEDFSVLPFDGLIDARADIETYFS